METRGGVQVGACWEGPERRLLDIDDSAGRQYVGGFAAVARDTRHRITSFLSALS